MKQRKIRYKTAKFFGHPEDSWARGNGRHGKKRSYGHYSGNSSGRTRAETLNADQLREGERDQA